MNIRTLLYMHTAIEHDRTQQMIKYAATRDRHNKIKQLAAKAAKIIDIVEIKIYNSKK